MGEHFFGRPKGFFYSPTSPLAHVWSYVSTSKGNNQENRYTLNPNVNWEWVELSAIYLSTWSMVFCSMRHSYVSVSNVCCQLLYTFLNCLSRYRGKSIADFLSQEQNKEIKMKEVKFFSLNWLSYFDPLTKKSWIPNHKIVWGVALWQNRKSYGFTASWKTAYNSRQTL